MVVVRPSVEDEAGVETGIGDGFPHQYQPA